MRKLVIGLISSLMLVPMADAKGKVDGAFINGHVQLTKEPPKNRWLPGGPVVVVVDKSSHYTYVFELQKGDKVYDVLRASNAIGKEDTPTPFGPYKVATKVKWPSWIPPKKMHHKPVQPYNKTHANPLGVARIGLNKFGVNLHGTNDPSSLRKSVSHGCIRHSNRDISKIFNMVKDGTTVLIVKHMPGTVLTKKEFYS
jgi:lipoprotein-anchoring transpeptidase ErfK/SrfK